MQPDAQFRVLLGALLACTVVVRAYYQARSFGAREARRLEGTLNIALRLTAGFLGLAALIVVLVQPAWMSWALVPLWSWLRWAGAVLGFGALILLVWSHHELGRNFSGTLEVRPEQYLVTTGPYSRIRHPIYTALYGIVLAFFLLSANWLVGVFFGGALTAVMVTRVRKEDALMEATFGGAYRAWAPRTGRFLPPLIG